MNTKSNLCLACMQSDEVYNIFEMHECEEFGQIDPAATILKNCFEIEITAQSELDSICGTCMLKLRDAYLFKLEIVKNTKEIIKQAHLQLEYLSYIDLTDTPGNNPKCHTFDLDSETGVIPKNSDDKEGNDDYNSNGNDKEQNREREVNVQNKQTNVLNKRRKTSIDNISENQVLHIEDENISLKNKALNEKATLKDLPKSLGNIKTYKAQKKKKTILFDNLSQTGNERNKDIDQIKNLNQINEYKIEILPKPILKNPGKPMLCISSETRQDKTIEIKIETPKRVKKSVSFIEAKKGKAQKTKETLTKYFNIKPGQTNCNICSKPFYTTKKLVEHMSIHSSKYMCEKCGKKYAYEDQLKRHMVVHLKGPFACSICDKLFRKFNTRNAHIWRAHQKGASPYVCSECGERFGTFHQRLHHLQDKHGRTEAKYPCPYCKNKYFYSGARSQHIRISHLRECPYKCSQCPMKFARRRYLLSHLATSHGIGEKRHECHVCQKRFFRNITLKYHLKTHEDKLYKCNICDATFTYKAVLKCHLKCHELTELTNFEDNVIYEDENVEDSNDKVYLVIQDE